MGFSLVGGQFLKSNQLRHFSALSFPLSGLFSLWYCERVKAFEDLSFVFIDGARAIFRSSWV
ncbi:hypothetical protein VT47_03150 [Pseudomonas syringae pv. syringae]|uniref:Uncharacterized protein n=1 Tax=Pseudomonas syringae pv. japonica str. M301072 TaxID=629262 RepID=F3FMD8_PSESX|nr:hypothetical protein PSYJA_21312 [Pseudomonas syringae pv. japonica str. M301072]KZL42067.1 hypothetical protein VT47_03150 [Pseudomonas syringae pv. syringae]